MFVSESDIPFELEEVHILSSGSYYFFTNFVISEINEGILFDWEVAQDVINLAINHYGENPNIGYVSNRVNSYSLKPQDWLKFFEARHTLACFAIVDPDKISSTLLEKIFFRSKIQKFTDLVEACHWADKLALAQKSKELSQ